MGDYDFGPAVDSAVRGVKLLLFLLVASVPLALWKIIELLQWLF